MIKSIFIILLSMLVLINFSIAGELSRSFDPSNLQVSSTGSLEITYLPINPPHTGRYTWLIEQPLPTGWKVKSVATGQELFPDSNNVFKDFRLDSTSVSYLYYLSYKEFPIKYLVS